MVKDRSVLVSDLGALRVFVGCDRASAIDYAAFLGFFFPEPS